MKALMLDFGDFKHEEKIIWGTFLEKLINDLFIKLMSLEAFLVT